MLSAFYSLTSPNIQKYPSCFYILSVIYMGTWLLTSLMLWENTVLQSWGSK